MPRNLFRSLATAALVLTSACADTAGGPTATSPALAKGGADGGGNPHFIYADFSASGFAGTKSKAPSASLTVDWKEAGLSNLGFDDLTYVLTASFSGAIQCYNPANNQPQGSPHAYPATDLSESGTFPVRNGSVTGSLSLIALIADQCRKPMYPVLVSGTFTDIVLTSGSGQTATSADLTVAP